MKRATLSVILLALMWSLSPTKTFSFLLSDNTWAGVIRIVLMIAEMAWFYYLYDSFNTSQEINKELQELEENNLDPYKVREFIEQQTGTRSKYNIKYIKNRKAFIIKHWDNSSSKY